MIKVSSDILPQGAFSPLLPCGCILSLLVSVLLTRPGPGTLWGRWKVADGLPGPCCPSRLLHLAPMSSGYSVLPIPEKWPWMNIFGGMDWWFAPKCWSFVQPVTHQTYSEHLCMSGMLCAGYWCMVQWCRRPRRGEKSFLLAGSLVWLGEEQRNLDTEYGMCCETYASHRRWHVRWILTAKWFFPGLQERYSRGEKVMELWKGQRCSRKGKNFMCLKQRQGIGGRGAPSQGAAF